MLSVPAVQVRATDVAVGAEPATLVGAVGGEVSTVHVYVAGDGSLTPFAVE